MCGKFICSVKCKTKIKHWSWSGDKPNPLKDGGSLRAGSLCDLPVSSTQFRDVERHQQPISSPEPGGKAEFFQHSHTSFENLDCCFLDFQVHITQVRCHIPSRDLEDLCPQEGILREGGGSILSGQSVLLGLDERKLAHVS